MFLLRKGAAIQSPVFEVKVAVLWGEQSAVGKQTTGRFRGAYSLKLYKKRTEGWNSKAALWRRQYYRQYKPRVFTGAIGWVSRMDGCSLEGGGPTEHQIKVQK